jgi:hypothetical protein
MDGNVYKVLTQLPTVTNWERKGQTGSREKAAAFLTLL